MQTSETIIDTPFDGTITLTLAAPPGTSMVLSDPTTGTELASSQSPNF